MALASTAMSSRAPTRTPATTSASRPVYRWRAGGEAPGLALEAARGQPRDHPALSEQEHRRDRQTAQDCGGGEVAPQVALLVEIQPRPDRQGQLILALQQNRGHRVLD